MNKFKIAIAGGGSTFTPGIVRSLLKNKEQFKLEELRFYDNNEERQNRVGIIVKKIVEEMDPNLKLVYTTDPKEAFSNIDFVFAQIRVGLYKMRELDEKIPLKYGVIGQETCGLGGLAYGLRMIYPMTELVDFVEEYAKDTCWVINYSNPAAIIAEALRRLRPNAKILNICDMPISIEERMAHILGCSISDITSDYFGLNHFGWFTRLTVNGIDRTDELREHVSKYGYLPKDLKIEDIPIMEKSWVETYRNVKYLVDMFPEYLPNTYMQYYLLSDLIIKQSNINHTRANEVIEGREKRLFDTIEKYNRTGKLDLSQFAGTHGEFIVDVAKSLAYDLRKRYLVIVENKGAINNFREDAMVEIPAYLTSKGPEPVRIGEIPTFYKGLMEQQVACEKLIVDAAIENSYEKALMAFTINKTVRSAIQAKKILDEMIEANKQYWPELR